MLVALEQFASLAEIPGLLHGVTTRAGGESQGAFASLNVGLGCGDIRERVLGNRRRVASVLGADTLVIPRQVHGDRIAMLDDGSPPPEDGCDGLMTRSPGRLLGVLGADCPGVLLVAPECRTLAVVHAGWRGIAASIVLRALERLEQHAGVAPGDVRVGIGPGISTGRYEVSAQVAESIQAALPEQDREQVVHPTRPGHAHVDLHGALRAQLLGAGVSAASIETHPACTYDDPRFFSHRRDKGITGRHALIAGWRS